MLPWVCSVIEHRRRQNVVRTSVTHSAIASHATFLFLPHFDVICDLLLNRRTATWNLFVKYIYIYIYIYISRYLLYKYRDLHSKKDRDKNSLFALEKPADWSYDFFH